MLQQLMDEALAQLSKDRDPEIVLSMLQTAYAAGFKVSKKYHGILAAHDIENSVRILFTTPSVGVEETLAKKIAEAIVAKS